jgi:hypothetical protein
MYRTCYEREGGNEVDWSFSHCVLITILAACTFVISLAALVVALALLNNADKDITGKEKGS